MSLEDRTMGTIVAKAHDRLTVHTLNPVQQRGPVLYAALPCGRGARQRLVSTLWDHLEAQESPLWKRFQTSGRAAMPLQVVRGPLGRPQLMLGECQGPAISFSEEGGQIWAALYGAAADIGIDVAGREEFQGGYPFHRVFQPPELQHAVRLTGGDLTTAAALLWSIKEAVVKALGCAFHLVDPRQISVYPAERGAALEEGGYSFAVGLSGKARMRFPLAVSRALWVRSLPRGQRWLSIALLQRRSTDHG